MGKRLAEIERQSVRVVWKFELPCTDAFTLSMPKGAEILSVQVQHGKPRIWALGDPNAAKEPRRFALVGTGHPVPGNDDDWSLRFVGTFQAESGLLVFHLFEAAQSSGEKALDMAGRATHTPDRSAPVEWRRGVGVEEADTPGAASLSSRAAHSPAHAYEREAGWLDDHFGKAYSAAALGDLAALLDDVRRETVEECAQAARAAHSVYADDIEAAILAVLKGGDRG